MPGFRFERCPSGPYLTKADVAGLTDADGRIGIRFEQTKAILNGTKVASMKIIAIASHSSFYGCGLDKDDRIISVQDFRFDSTHTFATFVISMQPGTFVRISYLDSELGKHSVLYGPLTKNTDLLSYPHRTKT